ncbi:hypothetical protein NBRC111894_4656 [Sporolactobacillus inulinus]|uniref:Uncharacterized protein n=2 Tax=Sporolactobacillus inulinus TaxID=2078 RepID=A0A4Y1ZIR8_9BACL|nr:hypothetical protein NBRC111894_4656 [Sporolactobacillus inulinus]
MVYYKVNFIFQFWRTACIDHLFIAQLYFSTSAQDDSTLKRHETITQGWRLTAGRFLTSFSYR